MLDPDRNNDHGPRGARSIRISSGLGSANNGNVLAIAHSLDPGRNQSFTYDHLNRIQTAQVPSAWGLSFGYDIWGNLLSQTVTQGSAPMLSVAATTKNQIVGFCYDSAGNLKHQGACPGTSYTYDAENRLLTAGGVTSTYDGDGKRVKKSNGTLYWHGGGSDTLMETDLSGNPLDEYVFFNGQRIARRRASDSAVFYFFSDHLGSSRIVTDSAGTVVEDSDFYPFGAERVVLDGLNNNYKFTGQERDSESGLDYFIARHYGYSLGRFISPDPVAMTVYRLIDPQTINLYAYARNNPLVYVDPTGETIEFANEAARRGFEDYKATLEKDPEKNKDELATIQRLEQSQVAYVINIGQPSASAETEGELTTDGQKVFVTVSNVGGPSGEKFSLNSRFAHELEHARQFDNGEFSFAKNPDGSWRAYHNFDIFDEVKAWKAQLNVASARDFFTAGKPNILSDFANAKTDDERAGVLARTSAYGNLPKASRNYDFFSTSGKKPGELVRTTDRFGVVHSVVEVKP